MPPSSTWSNAVLPRTDGTACPQARTTTTHRLARRRSGRLQLPMAGRDPNSPGTVIFVPTIPLALSKSPISRNGFGLPPRRDGHNAVELSDALLASVQWAWWRGVQFQHCCPEHPPTCWPLHENREGNWHCFGGEFTSHNDLCPERHELQGSLSKWQKAEKSAFGASFEAKRHARAESCSVTVSS